MEINIYAPVDGFVKNIDQCSDQMFADRMLGDGFVIIPKQNQFKAFFDKGKVSMVFDTKHAYGFEILGLNFLLHCGIDTVTLNGEGFISNIKIDDTITKNDDLFSIDLDYVKSKNLLIETPIVFEFNNLSKYEIKDLKTGQVKQGDLLCKIIYEQKEIINEDISRRAINDPVDFFSVQGKYQKAAVEINKLVGTQSNYSQVYNCMTRLRFKIKDKNKINLSELKAHSIVRGTVWNGDELQIIIGQDVAKLKDEVVKNNSEIIAMQGQIAINKEKNSLMKRFFAMFSGIMIRLIPAIIAVGLIQGLMTILVQAKIMPNIALVADKNNNIIGLKEAKFYWALLFVAARTTNYFFGVLIASSAAKYFKFDQTIAVSIGLILCAPIMFYEGGPFGFGPEWPLFKIKEFNVANFIPNPNPGIDKPQFIVIPNMLNILLNKLTIIQVNTMNIKIFVIIPIIFIAKKLDTWVKTWISMSLDLMLRPFIVLIICIPLGFFVIGPLWNIIEGLFGLITYYLTKIPFGIGVGIFSALWQCAVVFGIHIMLAIIAAIDSMINKGQTYLITEISVWGQVGALIGVIIMTRDAKLRRQGIKTLPAGFLGISEPLIYGINLPKKRPLLAGVMAAFIAGSLGRILQLTNRVSSGLGIFATIGFFAEPTLGGEGILNPIKNGLFNILCDATCFGLGILFCTLIYKERKEEKTLLSQTISKAFLYTKLQLNMNDEQYKKLKEKQKEIINSFDKNILKNIKLNEKNIQSYIYVCEKLNSIKEKEEEMKEKLMIKGKKLIAKEKIKEASLIMKKYNDIDFSHKITELEKIKDEQYKKIDFNWLNQNMQIVENKIKEKINSINEFDQETKNNLEPLIYNIVNSLQIHYGLLEPKPIEVNFNQLIANKKELDKKSQHKQRKGLV